MFTKTTRWSASMLKQPWPAAVILVAALALSACSGSPSPSSSPSPSPAPKTLQSIEITPGTTSAAAGTTTQLSATGIYSDSSHQDITSQVTWSSSSRATAILDVGRVTACRRRRIRNLARDHRDLIQRMEQAGLLEPLPTCEDPEETADIDIAAEAMVRRQARMSGSNVAAAGVCCVPGERVWASSCSSRRTPRT